MYEIPALFMAKYRPEMLPRISTTLVDTLNISSEAVERKGNILRMSMRWRFRAWSRLPPLNWRLFVFQSCFASSLTHNGSREFSVRMKKRYYYHHDNNDLISMKWLRAFSVPSVLSTCFGEPWSELLEYISHTILMDPSWRFYPVMLFILFNLLRYWFVGDGRSRLSSKFRWWASWSQFTC